MAHSRAQPNKSAAARTCFFTRSRLASPPAPAAWAPCERGRTWSADAAAAAAAAAAACDARLMPPLLRAAAAAAAPAAPALSPPAACCCGSSDSVGASRTSVTVKRPLWTRHTRMAPMVAERGGLLCPCSPAGRCSACFLAPRPRQARTQPPLWHNIGCLPYKLRLFMRIARVPHGLSRPRPRLVRRGPRREASLPRFLRCACVHSDDVKDAIVSVLR